MKPSLNQSFWGSIVYGFFSPLRALQTAVKHPAILAIALVPLAINIAIYILYFYHGSRWISAQMDGVYSGWILSLPD
jgi:hypothetical protein